MTRKGIYGDFGEELDDVPDQPDILAHNKVLAVIAKRAAKRLAKNDGRSFRSEMASLAREADEHLSEMVADELEGRDRSKHGPLLSGCLTRIQALSAEGLVDMDAEVEFMDVVERTLKRVEEYEKLKSARINALSASAVEKLMDGFARILRDYLPRERAQKAYAELLNLFPKNAEQVGPREIEPEG